MSYRKPSYAELCWDIIKAKLKEVLRMPHRCKGVSWADGKTEFGGAQKNKKSLSNRISSPTSE